MVRAAWIGLCLTPIALGLWRYRVLYLADGDAIWFPYRSVALYPSDLFVIAVGLCWLVGQVLAGRNRLPFRIGNRPVAIGLVLLVLTTAAGVPFAYDALIAAGVAGQLLVLLLFYFATVNLLASFDRRPVLAGVALMVIAESSVGLWQVATQSTAPAGMLLLNWGREFVAADRGASVVGLPGIERWLRAYGAFAHPNILGGFLAVALALLAGSSAPTVGWLRRLALGLGTIALALSFSRAAWLAAFSSGTALLWARHRPRSARFRLPTRRLTFGGLALLGLLFAALIAVRVANLATPLERTSIDERFFYYGIAWQVMQRGAPVGAGNLVLAQQQLGLPWHLLEPAHDVLLIVGAELGPTGLIAWFILLAAAAAAVLRAHRYPTGWAGPASATLALLPLLLFDHYLWTQPPGRALVVWALALLSAADERAPAGTG